MYGYKILFRQTWYRETYKKKHTHVIHDLNMPEAKTGQSMELNQTVKRMKETR